MTTLNDSKKQVRVRFAPSPTGHLHIGGGRTALYNFLFARHHGGKFLLRIEDTDKERSTDESTKGIFESLKWLGLKWDEDVVYQSQNFPRHVKAVEQLLQAGKAYHCYCSPEELEVMRAAALKAGQKPAYDGRCRNLTAPPAGKEQVKPVVRFKGPQEGEVTFRDLIRGEITFLCRELDDLILLRSDGSPTYNLSVVIDDADMNITHVIRGDDHLNNTPRQLLLFQALGHTPPQYAHLAMILGPDKKKLSKRHNVPSVMVYQEMGFLPEALNNYLVRLGWSHGDQEVFTLEELIQHFDLDHVGSSASALNFEKLQWLNGTYLRLYSAEKLWPMVLAFIPAEKRNIEYADSQTKFRIVELTKERSKNLVDMARLAQPFFSETVEYDEKAKSEFLSAQHAGLLTEAVAVLRATGNAGSLSASDVESLKEKFKAITEAKGIKFVTLAQTLRVCLTGNTVSPSIYDVIEILGKDRALKRMDLGLQVMKG